MRISKLLKWIGITVAVCVLILFIKNEYTYLLLQDANYGIPALIKQGSVDNLYLGSSMFRQGLDIETLNENGESNYILSYNGNQPYLEYIILKKLIDNGVKIKNLYVDMYAYSVVAEPNLSDEKILLEFSLSDKLEIYRIMRNSENYEAVLSKAKLLWQMFVSSNNDTLLSWPISHAVVDSQFYQGGTLSYSAGIQDSAKKEKLFSPNRYSSNEYASLNELQVYYLESLLFLTRISNINVIFLETPKTPLSMNDNYYDDIMRQYSSLVSQNEIPMITADKVQLFGNLDESYFSDVLHLSTKGRIFYSLFLNEYIRERD